MDDDDSEVAAVMFGEGLQADDVCGLVQQCDTGQRSDPEPNQSTVSEEQPSECVQEEKLSEHEIDNDETKQQLSSKTAKAAELVLGKLPEVIQLDKLRNNLTRNPKSRYCVNRYENHLAKIQVLVLKAIKKLDSDIKAWDASFLMQHKRVPNPNDYETSQEATDILHRRKVALKLLQSWKITVHL